MKKLFVLFILLWGSLSFADDGAYYFNRGLDADNSGNYTKAAELYKKSCDMGYAPACKILKKIGMQEHFIFCVNPINDKINKQKFYYVKFIFFFL